jgi:dual specificity tyrosine-phosphorylation-regulated kinase 2/3/4
MATAQRVASLRSSTSTSTSSSSAAPRTSSSSRLTSQTVSSMQKQSDSSLRTRNQLPTIAGSPSVGTNSSQTSKEAKEPPPLSLMNAMASHPKETPTKIPRISSRTSGVPSPTLKNSTSIATSRRTSIHSSGLVAPSADPSPTPGEPTANEFGVIENGAGSKPPTSRHSIRTSPSMSSSRVPRQVSGPNSSMSTGVIPRKANRESLSFSGIRKSSTGSVASISSVAPTESNHRFPALSPSKGIKLLSPKISHSAARASNSSSTQNIHQVVASPNSSRQSLSTPSPVPSSVDEEELLGDEEMMHYIRRQQTKKMANGATQEELDELLRFPEPLPPGEPLSPAGQFPR